MRTFLYRKVNAFTAGASKGNPAAYLDINDNMLTHEEMLEIAKEHQGFVSEVVFCSASAVADVKLTYYSSECEVDFCGHGTIATMVDYIRNNAALRSKDEVRVETNRKGILTVYNHLDADGSIFITAPRAQWFPVPVSKEETVVALGISQQHISLELPLDLIDAGLRTLIVPISDLGTEVSVYPSLETLKTFCLENGIDIILIFSLQASSPDRIAHTRVFAPKFGYLEDPATGSGNSAFANYMIRNSLWDGSLVRVEQGGDKFVYNAVSLMKQGEEILFGGGATVRITGEYQLP